MPSQRCRQVATASRACTGLRSRGSSWVSLHHPKPRQHKSTRRRWSWVHRAMCPVNPRCTFSAALSQRQSRKRALAMLWVRLCHSNHGSKGRRFQAMIRMSICCCATRIRLCRVADGGAAAAAQSSTEPTATRSSRIRCWMLNPGARSKASWGQNAAQAVVKNLAHASCVHGPCKLNGMLKTFKAGAAFKTKPLRRLPARSSKLALHRIDAQAVGSQSILYYAYLLH